MDSEGSDDEKMILDDDSDDSMKLGELEDESEKEEEVFDSVSTGDFVKVVYKGEYFPGSVQEKNEKCQSECHVHGWSKKVEVARSRRLNILSKGRHFEKVVASYPSTQYSFQSSVILLVC